MKNLVKHIGLSLAALLLSSHAVMAGMLPGVDRDNGTGPDGIMIFPSKLAMFCDISSTAIDDENTVKNCLNKLLLESKGSLLGKQDYNEIFRDSFRQMNNVYLTDALRKKSSSGDSEDEIDQATEEDISAAGALKSEADNLRKKQEQNAVLYGMTASKTADIIEVYSSALAMQAMNYYYQNEFGSASAPVDEPVAAEKKDEQ